MKSRWSVWKTVQAIKQKYFHELLPWPSGLLRMGHPGRRQALDPVSSSWRRCWSEEQPAQGGRLGRLGRLRRFGRLAGRWQGSKGWPPSHFSAQKPTDFLSSWGAWLYQVRPRSYKESTAQHSSREFGVRAERTEQSECPAWCQWLTAVSVPWGAHWAYKTR